MMIAEVEVERDTQTRTAIGTSTDSAICGT